MSKVKEFGRETEFDDLTIIGEKNADDLPNGELWNEGSNGHQSEISINIIDETGNNLHHEEMQLCISGAERNGKSLRIDQTKFKNERDDYEIVAPSSVNRKAEGKDFYRQSNENLKSHETKCNYTIDSGTTLATDSEDIEVEETEFRKEVITHKKRVVNSRAGNHDEIHFIESIPIKENELEVSTSRHKNGFVGESDLNKTDISNTDNETMWYKFMQKFKSDSPETKYKIDENIASQPEETKTPLTWKKKLLYGLLFVGVAILAVILIVIAVSTSSNNDHIEQDLKTQTTAYVHALLDLTVNDTYTTDMGNSLSYKYKRFASDFCAEIDRVLNNNTGGFGDNYIGCIVFALNPGSIKVSFTVYCVDISESDMINQSVKYIKDNILRSGNLMLGGFQILLDSFETIQVSTIHLHEPPELQEVFTSTTKSKVTTTAHTTVDKLSTLTSKPFTSQNVTTSSLPDTSTTSLTAPSASTSSKVSSTSKFISSTEDTLLVTTRTLTTTKSITSSVTPSQSSNVQSSSTLIETTEDVQQTVSGIKSSTKGATVVLNGTTTHENDMTTVEEIRTQSVISFAASSGIIPDFVHTTEPSNQVDGNWGKLVFLGRVCRNMWEIVLNINHVSLKTVQLMVCGQCGLPWSSCNVTCGGGLRHSQRTCTNPAPKFGGEKCVGEDTMFDSCSEMACPIDGTWLEWSLWSTCDVTCGNGSMSRSRSCSRLEFEGKDCEGNTTDIGVCENPACPIDGNWSTWLSWGECSLTCGDGGIRQRNRTCSDPVPMFGGNECDGDGTTTGPCQDNPCPINGAWSDWNPWEKCSKTCGSGTKSRSRKCSDPLPQHGGNFCDGFPKEYTGCEEEKCQVIGYWSPWGTWDACSVTCDTGISFKRRICFGQSVNDDEQVICIGDGTENKTCQNDPCPVDGGWSNWNEWDKCSLPCGGGIQTRNRSCNNPVPQHGGKLCDGNDTEHLQCNNQNCPGGSCTDATAYLYDEDISISCIITGRLNSMPIIITKNGQNIAAINEHREVQYLSPSTNFKIVIKQAENITLSLVFRNVTCENDGLYEVQVNSTAFNGVNITGSLMIIDRPTVPVFFVNPDQFAGLPYRQSDYEHQCSGNIGKPTGELIIEIKLNNSEFSIVPPADLVIVQNSSSTKDCRNFQILKFTMNFTSDMNEAVIRCRVQNDFILGGEIIGSEVDLSTFSKDTCNDVYVHLHNSATIMCTLNRTKEYKEIMIVKIKDGVSVNISSISKSGDITYFQDHLNIQIRVITSFVISIDFLNTTCADEGDYVLNISNGTTITARVTGSIQPISDPGKPSLFLNPAVVVESGSDNEAHNCYGNVGYPMGTFNCHGFQNITFLLNVDGQQNNQTLRCRVENKYQSDVISYTDGHVLRVIPKDICKCNTIQSGIRRGHPGRCDYYVECVNMTVPVGKQCLANQCRNSSTGICADDCSDNVCKETVPADFCGAVSIPSINMTSTDVPSISRKPSIPNLEMNKDQVINLGYYRPGFEHVCSGDVGEPPGNLILEIQHTGSTSFEPLQDQFIKIIFTSIEREHCYNNTMTVVFGMLFYSAMINGKIRCRVDNSVSLGTNEIFADTEDLHLIPEDICNCNTDDGAKRGHPTVCDVFVQCTNFTVPQGLPCPSLNCRSSITGECGTDCSVKTCSETVPKDALPDLNSLDLFKDHPMDIGSLIPESLLRDSSLPSSLMGRDIQTLSPLTGLDIQTLSPLTGRDIQTLSPLTGRDIQTLSPLMGRDIQTPSPLKGT
ncbi:HMCN [Mytilus edulis]|uniref:HMCN n=1 Tax=Mytilus edulis TaxID=6550 RepID=A0A8S3SZM9_MYTED|nr:HMCN [Mytilus edulis]